MKAVYVILASDVGICSSLQEYLDCLRTINLAGKVDRCDTIDLEVGLHPWTLEEALHDP